MVKYDLHHCIIGWKGVNFPNWGLGVEAYCGAKGAPITQQASLETKTATEPCPPCGGHVRYETSSSKKTGKVPF
jgi:hypothetical protein